MPTDQFIGVSYDLHQANGKSIYLPPWYSGELGWGNLESPNVYRADGATQKYPAGTRYTDGERVWYYGKWIGQISSTEFDTALQAPNSTALTVTAGRFMFAHVFQQDYSNADLNRHLANEQHTVIVATASEARSDDYYSGGWFSGKDTGDNNRPFHRFIVKHEFDATGQAAQKILNGVTGVVTEVDLSALSNVSVLELEREIITSKTTLATTIMPNSWKHMIYKTQGETVQFQPALGALMPNAVDQNDWVWVQTYGPIFIPWAFVEFSGALTGEIMFKISGDGSTSPQHSGAPSPADGSTWQTAGWAMGSSAMEAGTSGTDEELVMMFLTLRR